VRPKVLQTLGRTNCLQGFVSTTCLAKVSENLPKENGDTGQSLQQFSFRLFLSFVCRMIHCLMRWLTSVCVCARARVCDVILSQKCDVRLSFRSIRIVTKDGALPQHPCLVLATGFCRVFLLTCICLRRRCIPCDLATVTALS